MNILLYILTTAIWGSTWLAIQYQLGIVPPVWSVAYRFALASLLLIALSASKACSLAGNNTV
jgi:drug/metabolite transporter (DMT)-like permease